MLAVPIISLAQWSNPAPVNLLPGVTGYAALAYSAVTNTDSAFVNGNVGVSPLATVNGLCTVSGCPGLVTGNIDQANATSAQGQVDLGIAYNDAFSRTPDVIYGVTTNLGGLTISRGVYKFEQDVEIIGTDLILDGGGNSGSIFIFQIMGKLTVNNGSIMFINGAQPGNVFWQVAGNNATIGTISNFGGTIMANGYIALQPGVVLNGRALSKTEYVSIDGKDSIIIPVICPALLINLGNDTSQCGGTITLTLDAGNPGSSYNWNTGETTQIITVSTTVTDTFYVNVTTSSGCVGTDTIIISIHPIPVVNLGNDTAFCADIVVLDAGNPGSTYQWNSGNTSQTNIIYFSGTYIVNVTNTFGCTATDTITITIYSFPQVNLGTDIVQCGNTVVNLDAGNITSTHLWSTGDTTKTISVYESGTYYVDVTNAYGCARRDTVLVKINEVPSIPEEITGCTSPCAGQTNMTYAVPAVSGATSYTWILPSDWIINAGENTNTITVTTGSYPHTVLVIANTHYPSGTCSSPPSEGLLVSPDHCEDYTLNFPNTFTPDGDGINETWVIRNMELYPDNEIVIINRWGNEVYSNKTYLNDWNGQELNEGTYYYVMKVKNTTSMKVNCLPIGNNEVESHTGYVTIIR